MHNGIVIQAIFSGKKTIKLEWLTQKGCTVKDPKTSVLLTALRCWDATNINKSISELVSSSPHTCRNGHIQLSDRARWRTLRFTSIKWQSINTHEQDVWGRPHAEKSDNTRKTNSVKAGWYGMITHDLRGKKKRQQCAKARRLSLNLSDYVIFAFWMPCQ